MKGKTIDVCIGLLFALYLTGFEEMGKITQM